MHNGHVNDMQHTRNGKNGCRNVHPTDKYRIKRTAKGSVQDKTDKQDVRKN